MNNEMCVCNGACGTEGKTSSAKGIVRINYKEDFELVVELLAGDNPYTLGDEDFRIDFIVMASRYTVGRTGGVCERCAVDDNKIRCFMDSHGLPPGELRAEVKVNTPDPNYADGSRLNVAIAEGVVLLVKDNTRFDGAVVKANIPVALVDAYQLAKAHGYKGTIDEYYDTFTDVGHLKEILKTTIGEMTKAEKLRADAETERAKAETVRQSNRDKFNTAESERVKNEQQRQTNEEARKTAETQRQTNEDARQKAENERATAEGKRADTDKERDELVAKMQAAWQEIERMKNVREGEYGKEIELVEKIKNAAKIPTQNVWLDATDGEIKSTPASEDINANAYKYYYIGRREVAGSSGRCGNKYLRSLDLSNWDTSRMSSASYMFSGSLSLQSIDVGNWNTGLLADASYMFLECPSLKCIDVSSWDTKEIRDAYCMFMNCQVLASIDVSNWETKEIRSMTSMFFSCKSLQLLDFRKANFNKVKDAERIFTNCNALVELWLPLTFDLLTSIDLSIPSWGATTEGLASLRWTFGEGADDRTAKGLQPCTVRLHANVYDRLTDTERTAAAKKGWTITK